jgi:hypothetical protein
MTILFQMDAETALEFFERVQKLEEDTEENRIKILMDMAREGKKIAASQTNRTKEEVIQDKAKHGRILYVKSPEEERNGL